MKKHILKSEDDYFGYYAISYCGMYTEEEGLFLQRAVKGDICKNCIRARIVHKRRIRAL